MSFCFHALKSSTLFNRIILDAVEKEGFTDLTPALLGIFAHLAEAEPMSISALANALGSSRQALHKSVTKLVALGYVVLEIRPPNRKEKIVVLTGRGEAMVKVALRTISRTEARMAEFLGAQEFEEYLQKQRKLTEFLEKKLRDGTDNAAMLGRM